MVKLLSSIAVSIVLRTWVDDVKEPLMNYASVFNKAAQTNDVWVKRVIGRPGDVLEFKDGHVMA